MFHTSCLNMSHVKRVSIRVFMRVSIRISHRNTCFISQYVSQHVSHITIRVSCLNTCLTMPNGTFDWRGLVADAAAATLCTPAPLTQELKRPYMHFTCACPHVPQYVSQDTIRVKQCTPVQTEGTNLVVDILHIRVRRLCEASL